VTFRNFQKLIQSESEAGQIEPMSDLQAKLQGKDF
jgi:hypothetical protein